MARATPSPEAEDAPDDLAELDRTRGDYEARYVAEAMAAVGAAIQPGASGAGDVGDRDPLLTACRAVGAELGIAFDPAMVHAPDDAREGLDALADRFGFAWRPVALSGEWYRRDAGPLIAWSAAGAPRVLVRRAGSYWLLDPTTVGKVRVDACVAASLAPDAAMLYRLLPEGTAGAGSLFHAAIAASRGQGRTLAFAAAAIGILSLALPLATGLLFGVTVGSADRGQVLVVVAGLVALTAGRAVYEMIVALTVLRLRGRVEHALYAAIWERLLRLPAGFFRRFQVGDLEGRGRGAIDLAHHGARLPGTMVTAVGGLLSAALMIALGGPIGVLCLGLLLAMHGLAVLITLSGAGLVERMVSAQALLDSFGLQMIELIAKLKVGGAERRAFATWMGRYAPVTGATRRAQTRQLAAGLIVAEIPLLLGIVAFAALASRPGAMGLGQFVAFAAAMGQFASAIGALASQLPPAVLMRQVFRRMAPLLREAPEDGAGRRRGAVLEGRIEFDRVSFGYLPDAPPIVDAVSFTIEPGEMVAIVGPSGAGKSTLLRLLLGFEQPRAGAILLDSRNLAHLDLLQVRRQMGVVLQHAGLIGSSIFQNIAAAAPLTIDKAWAAAHQAGLAEDIAAMPMGMNTRVDGQGSLLSGGQRQRLMLARALARRPRILVLDEATSALDNRTQDSVVTNLNALGMTRVVVAHRLSTVRRADRILVLEEGRLIQSGSFGELTTSGGLFANLIRRQLA